jgi:hypothetical protein
LSTANSAIARATSASATAGTHQGRIAAPSGAVEHDRWLRAGGRDHRTKRQAFGAPEPATPAIDEDWEILAAPWRQHCCAGAGFEGQFTILVPEADLGIDGHGSTVGHGDLVATRLRPVLTSG